MNTKELQELDKGLAEVLGLTTKIYGFIENQRTYYETPDRTQAWPVDEYSPSTNSDQFMSLQIRYGISIQYRPELKRSIRWAAAVGGNSQGNFAAAVDPRVAGCKALLENLKERR